MDARHKLSQAMKKLSAAEADIIGREFLAPVVRGHGVGIHIQQVRFSLNVKPTDFQGWGIFRIESLAQAQWVRDGTLAQRRRYLDLFPSVRLILSRREKSNWLAVLANGSDERFSIDGAVPLELVDEAELYDTAVARFDGARFWFDAADDRADPAIARLLRESQAKNVEPTALQRPGMTAEQRAAYELNYRVRASTRKVDQLQREEMRLRNALAHAGAELQDYSDQRDIYRVSYTVDGRPHQSMIRKNDLTVLSSGICLSGRDADFDLKSLVGVLREGA